MSKKEKFPLYLSPEKKAILERRYEVAHRQDFPTITLGSRIIVPRDKFMAWIEEQAAQKTEIF